MSMLGIAEQARARAAKLIPNLAPEAMLFSGIHTHAGASCFTSHSTTNLALL